MTRRYACVYKKLKELFVPVGLSMQGGCPNPPNEFFHYPGRSTKTVPGNLAYNVGYFVNVKKPDDIKPVDNRIYGRLTAQEKQAIVRHEIIKNVQDGLSHKELIRRSQFKVLEGSSKREYEGILEKYNEDLDARREQLHRLLDEEEKEYILQIECRHETPDDRHQRYIARLKELREKRELERKAFVQEKYDQKFRQESDELKTIISARHAAAVAADRDEQLREVEALKELDAVANNYHQQLWYEDYLKKVAREEVEAQQRYEKNVEQVEILHKQMATKEAAQQLLQQLKEEEKQLCLDQKELFEKQKQYELEQIRLHKERTKSDLKGAIDYLTERKNKEIELNKAYENDLLRAANDSLKREEALLQQKKCEDKKGALAYLEFVKKQKQAEKDRAKEMERRIEQQNDLIWQHRANIHRRAAERRRLFMDEIVQSQLEQIKLQEEQRQKETQTLRGEDEDLLKNLDSNKYYGEDKTREKRALRDKVKRDVKEQMAFDAERRLLEKKEVLIEYEKCKLQEEEYKKKLKEILEQAPISNIHPMRLAVQDETAPGEQTHTDTVETIYAQTTAISNLLNPVDKNTKLWPDEVGISDLPKASVVKEKTKFQKTANELPVANRILHYYEGCLS